MSVKLTPAEVKWTEAILKKMDGHASHKLIIDWDLVGEYMKKFNRKITVAGIHNRLRKWSIRQGTYTPQVGKSKNKAGKFFQKSNYIVYVPGSGQTCGYDNEKELIQAIEKFGIVGDIVVFKKVTPKIKFSIKIV